MSKNFEGRWEFTINKKPDNFYVSYDSPEYAGAVSVSFDNDGTSPGSTFPDDYSIVTYQRLPNRGMRVYGGVLSKDKKKINGRFFELDANGNQQTASSSWMPTRPGPADGEQQAKRRRPSSEQ
jgi:hypothetical protein